MNDMTYGVIQGLPADIEPAVRVAGISVFECLWPRYTVNDVSIGGPYSMRCVENKEDRRVKVIWRNKNDAVLRYVADNNGRAVAWMPDDRYWHNRLYLLDSPQNFPVVNYHTQKGTYPSTYIRIEIDILEKELKEKVEIYKVCRNGREVDYFKTKAECDKFIDAQAKVVTKITKDGILTESKQDFTYEVKPGVALKYKPNFAAMAKRYAGLEFGWTSCDEFMNSVKPAVMEKIKGARAKQEQSSPIMNKQELLNTLRSLTPEERAELLGVAKQEEEAPEVSVSSAPNEETYSQDEAPEEVVAPKKRGRKKKVLA